MSKQTMITHHPAAFAAISLCVALGAYSMVPQDALVGTCVAEGACAAVALAFLVGMRRGGIVGIANNDGEQTATEKASAITRNIGIVIVLVTAIGFVVGIARVMIPGRFETSVVPSGSNVPETTMLILLVCALTAIAEEVLFRGIAFPCFSAAFAARSEARPNLQSALVASALFALLHCLGGIIAGIAAGDVSATVSQLLHGVSSFAFGVYLCAVYQQTQSLFPTIAAHFGYDAALFLVEFAGAGILALGGVPQGAAGVASEAIACALFAPMAIASARSEL